MSELLEMDSLTTTQTILERVFAPFPVPPVVREVSPLEALRLKDVEALPCKKCMMKHKCTISCKIHRMYVNHDGVFSKVDTVRSNAKHNLTKQETKIFNYIIGEPI